MTINIDPRHSFENQILTYEGQLTWRRIVEAITTKEGEQWLIDNVTTPVNELRQKIRERDKK